MSADVVAFAGLEGGVREVAVAEVGRLGARIDGRLLRAGEPGWDAAVRVWNAMVATRPARVVQPASARDVALVVDFAREHGVLLSVKGGGHNIAGTALAEQGLCLDMSLLRDVTVDPDRRLVHVGAGCLLADVDTATQEHGLATVLGFVSDTGVAGLTLGGGFGYLARRFGWAVDNLAEMEVVTADGQVRVASENSHPDLFWALRGGGGNVGVVTRFTFRLHEVGPLVTGGLMMWGAERADEVLATYRRVTEAAPRELATGLVMRLAPPAPFVPEEWHGRPIIGLLVCHSGADPAADLAPFRAIERPVVDVVERKPYVEQQSMMDGTEPHGQHYYWKTEFLGELADGFLDRFREHALQVPTVLSESVVLHIGGALNERADDDGAVGNRDARYVTGFAASWLPGDAPDPHVAWARAGWEAVRPFSTGGNYVNFQLADDDEARTAAAYRTNFARLRRVKADLDPDNLFRVNRNVTPAGTAPAGARRQPASVRQRFSAVPRGPITSRRVPSGDTSSADQRPPT